MGVARADLDSDHPSIAGRSGTTACKPLGCQQGRCRTCSSRSRVACEHDNNSLTFRVGNLISVEPPARLRGWSPQAPHAMAEDKSRARGRPLWGVVGGAMKRALALRKPRTPAKYELDPVSPKPVTLPARPETTDRQMSATFGSQEAGTAMADLALSPAARGPRGDEAVAGYGVSGLPVLPPTACPPHPAHRTALQAPPRMTLKRRQRSHTSARTGASRSSPTAPQLV